MIRLLAFFLSLLALSLQSAGAHAETLYVSPTGSDAHSCSRTKPCRTLRRADALATPGTTVHVAPGHYEAVTLDASGTPGALIRWLSDRRWGAQISGNRSGPLSVVGIKGSYVDFDGFDVTGSGGPGTVGINVAGSFSEAIGNRVHDLAIPCEGSNGGAGIDLSGSHTGSDQAAIGNLVTDIGSAPRNGSCRSVHGIYASVPRVRILVNVVARAAGDGITSWHLATHLTISNNTSTENGGYGVLIGGDVWPFDQGSYVVNNIATFNYLGGIVECCQASPPQGGHYLNNLTYGSTDGPNGPLLDGMPAENLGTMHSDPEFVDSATDDYRLRPGSPAIDTGTSIDAPTTDFDGAVRPNGAPFSRGAFSQWGHDSRRRRRRE